MCGVCVHTWRMAHIIVRAAALDIRYNTNFHSKNVCWHFRASNTDTLNGANAATLGTTHDDEMAKCAQSISCCRRRKHAEKACAYGEVLSQYTRCVCLWKWFWYMEATQIYIQRLFALTKKNFGFMFRGVSN